MRDRFILISGKLLLIASSFLIPWAGLSQNTPSIDTAVGNSTGTTYLVGDIDNINPVTGNVFLNIPLLSYPQRGHNLKLEFKIYYNDKQWFLMNWPRVANNQYEPAQQPPFWTAVSNSQPMTNPSTMGVYVALAQHLDFGGDHSITYTSQQSGSGEWVLTSDLESEFVREANGAKHYIGDLEVKNCSMYGTASCPVYVSNAGSSYWANDATGFAPTNSTLSALGPDGVTYTLNPSSRLETISDPNGNAITETSTGWTDTIGRVIPGSTSGPGSATGVLNENSLEIDSNALIPGTPSSAGCSNGRIWQVPGVGSAVDTYYLCYSALSYQTAFNLDQTLNTTNYSLVSEASGSATVLTSIIMPNKQQYTFSYDQYGSISHISTPTGASFDYTWQNIVPLANPYDNHPLTRSIKTKTIHPGNGQPDRKWQYYWPSHTEGIITDPAGNDTARTMDPTWVSELRAYQGCAPDDNAPDKICSGATVLLKQEDYVRTGVANLSASTPFATMAVASLSETTTTTTTVPGTSGNLVSQAVSTLTPPYSSCTRTSMT